MQVTATPVLPALMARANTSIKPIDLASLQLPQAVDIAAEKVTINQMREQPASYDNTPVYISGLRNTKQKGAIATALDRNLVSSINSLGAEKVPFTVSNFFSQIGALSGETLEYRNDARRSHVSQEQAVKNPIPNFSLQPTSDKSSARLSVRTKDGDTIQIELKHKAIGVNHTTLEFSFVVDGSLSPAEQKALGELAAKLGEMGDEFFRTDTTELRNLKGIDTSVISHFNFSLRRPGADDTYVEQSYEFSVDDKAQTQTLKASDVRGYSVEITTQLQTLVNGNGTDAEMLQPYIELIRQATDDADVNNKSRRFMLDAFESMFVQFIEMPVTEAPEDNTELALAAFDAGLPDFKASIASEVKHNRNFYSQVSALSLTLEQQTRIETVGDALLIKQESRYALTNNRFEPLVGLERADLDNGNYRYVTEHVEGATSRILSMTGNKVNNLLIEQVVSREKEINEFHDFKLVDQQTDDFSDRKLQQFSEVLALLNINNQYSAIDELLSTSKENLFLDC